MKGNSISIGVVLLCLVTGCSAKSEAVKHKVVNIQDKIVASSDDDKGGNPEVKSINECFTKKDKARENCFNLFYPGDIKIYTYPSYGTKIKLAGRKSSIERKKFRLIGQERFIIYIDVSQIKIPIKCNIKSAKQSKYKNTITIDIPVKDIKNRVILKDNMGKILIDYQVEK